MSVPRPDILQFGTFEVDVRSGELRKQGKRIKLQEQPFQVLVQLLQRPGDVVMREDLRSQIWSADTFVDFDNSLNAAINKLREALGDSADNPRFIETLPRRGYRFIAPVTGIDGTTRGTAAGVLARGRSGKIFVTVAVVVLAAGIDGGLLWRSRHQPRLTEKDTILLADFTNTTGDPVFDETLKQGLRVQLEQSPFLNILSEQQVNEGLRLMGRPPDQRLTPELARDLCQRIGSKGVLTGSVSSLGAHYAIGLNALNCRTGASLGSEQVESDSREHILKALSESATRMRKRLGESLASVQKYDVPLERATTSSLEALRAYSLGQDTWRAKGPAASLPFFKRAAELDPNFAMAYGRIGTIYANAGEVALMQQNTSKAYELRNHVSERERLYLETHYDELMTGDLEKELETYEIWHQTYPQDLRAQHNLVSLYAALGQYERALKLGHELLPQQPENEDIHNELATVYLNLNQFDEAGAVLNQAAQRGLESEDLMVDRYALAFLKDDGGSMERLVASAQGKRVAEDRLLFFAACTAAYRGKWAEARKLFEQSVASAERDGSVSRAAVHQADAALMEAHAGYLAASADAERALKLAENFYTEGESALALALMGKEARASKFAADLNKNFPRNTFVQRCWLPTIRAAFALHHQNAADAIEALRATGSYDLSMCSGSPSDPIYVRGQAYLVLHDGRAAEQEFQKIISHPGIIGVDPVGALAHLGLARAYMLQRETAKARAAYQEFLTLWKEADPDIPIFKQAKAEYARLQ